MVENRLDVGGAVTFWGLADWSDRARLQAEFAALGLDAFAPEPRPAPACLRDALEDVLGGPRVLVRPLAARDGFAVVREDRGLAVNAYANVLTAWVRDGQAPRFDPWTADVDCVADAYRRQQGRVPAGQLSAALVKVVEAFGGIRLRPGGAVYWVPRPRLDEWVQVAHAAEQSSGGRPSAVYMLRHRLDADAVRAVKDAVVQEVQVEANRICNEVTAGDLGGRALETRKKQAADLRQKVLLYEDLLSLGLAGLHRAVDQDDQAALLLATHGFAETQPAGVG